MQKTNQLTLTIKKEWLKKIVSGEKTKEYRNSKDYYHKIFKDFNNETFLVENAPKTILLKNEYSLKTKEYEVKEINGCSFESPIDKSTLYCIIEVEKIRHETFINVIPPEMTRGQTAYTIYIKNVLEHNL